jgi:hypothetical protein
MDTYFTENDLLYLRGWTAKAITTLLGAPDIANKGKVGNCYLVKRVEVGEQSELYRCEADSRCHQELMGSDGSDARGCGVEGHGSSSSA